MTALDVILPLIAGVGGGVLAALIGGASLITLPLLIAAGLTPIGATICNALALTPSTLVAAWADREQLPAMTRPLLNLLLISLVFGGAGAVMLLVTSERLFALLIPALLGFATILFAYAPRVSAYLRARAARRGQDVGSQNAASSVAMMGVSFYGGYFGAGAGVLLLAALSLDGDTSYRAANVLKNVIGTLISIVGAAIFIYQDVVPWQPTLIMTAGAGFGGLLGGWIARVLPDDKARLIITIAGAFLTAAFAYRFWF